MLSNVFINLPVSDLTRSTDFWTSAGFELDPNFTDENAAAVKLSDSIYIMLLTHGMWARFMSKPIADPSETSSVINALGVDDVSEIDTIVDKAVAAGATEGQSQDYGWMRSRAFADADGHNWEITWMDPIAQAGGWDAIAAKYPDATPPE